MKLDYKTLIAVSGLVSLFSIVNYYIFNRLNVWLSFGLGWKFYALGIFLGIFSFINIIWHPLPIKSIYYILAYWFGFIFIAFSVFIAVDIFGNLFPVKQNYLAIAAILIISGLSVYSVSNNLIGRKMELVKIRSSKIKNPIRIVMISDTHISEFYSSEYLEGIVREINDQYPDIVCICGDFADGKADFSTIKPINKIRSPVYLVMGNHEIWNNHSGEVEKLFNKSKVNLLHKSKHKDVQLIGVHFKAEEHVLRERLKEIEIDTKKYNVLLYHEPKEVEVAQEAGIDLMLSGHTHAGQIFPWNCITRLAYKYTKGLYEYRGMKIYVSQGTGIWGPPMRLGSSNEITVIDLQPRNIENEKTI